jgi:hypothetical protein
VTCRHFHVRRLVWRGKLNKTNRHQKEVDIKKDYLGKKFVGKMSTIKNSKNCTHANEEMFVAQLSHLKNNKF